MTKKKKILHLEDDPEWRNIVKKALDGFIVYSVGSLEEAIGLFRKTDFDFAILDISLIIDDSQDDQGEFLLKGLKGLEILPGKRILILSAYLTGTNQNRMRKYFRDYKVIDSIPKQKFSAKELRNIVEDALKTNI